MNFRENITLYLVAAALITPITASAGIRTVRDNWDNAKPDYRQVRDAVAPESTSYSAPYYHYDNKAEKIKKTQEQRKIALSFPSSRESTGKRTFVFDPTQGGWAAYDESGSLVRTGIASGGSSWCSDVGRSCRTKVGSFSVYRKGGSGCKSNKFPIRRSGINGGAPMPHCMFFHGGFAVHGSYDVPNYNASHGCIRVLPTDAEWLNNDFLHVGSPVIVQPYST